MRIGIASRRAILNRFCRRWCARESCAACADRAAATSSRATRNDIGADEILRAAGTVEDHDDAPLTDSNLLANVVVPALERAEEKFSEALSRITVADLAKSADGGRKPDGD